MGFTGPRAAGSRLYLRRCELPRDEERYRKLQLCAENSCSLISRENGLTCSVLPWFRDCAWRPAACSSGPRTTAFLETRLALAAQSNLAWLRQNRRFPSRLISCGNKICAGCLVFLRILEVLTAALACRSYAPKTPRLIRARQSREEHSKKLASSATAAARSRLQCSSVSDAEVFQSRRDRLGFLAGGTSRTPGDAGFAGVCLTARLRAGGRNSLSSNTEQCSPLPITAQAQIPKEISTCYNNIAPVIGVCSLISLCTSSNSVGLETCRRCEWHVGHCFQLARLQRGFSGAVRGRPHHLMTAPAGLRILFPRALSYRTSTVRVPVYMYVMYSVRLVRSNRTFIR